MARTQLLTTVFAALLALGLAACSESPDSSEPTGSGGELTSVQFALKADVVSAGCPAALEFPDVRSVRLRLYEGTPDDPDTQTTLFDTSDRSFAADGCLSFVQCAGASPAVRMDANDGLTQNVKAETCQANGGILVGATVVDISAIEVGENVTAYFEAFSDDSCTDRAFVGMRGGIDIAKGGAGNYTITPLCVGQFTELPHPGQDSVEESRQIATTTCTTDCDCLGAVGSVVGARACTAEEEAAGTYGGAPLDCNAGFCSRGYAFEELLRTECTADTTCTDMFPHSSCDAASGRCTVFSYYPLNTREPRAFHTATALADGRIAIVGGLTRQTGSTFDASPSPIEFFEPETFTFSAAAIDIVESDADSDPSDVAGRALHATAVVGGGGGLAVVGGLRSMDIRFQQADGGDRELVLGAESAGLGQEANYRADILAIDIDVEDQRAATRRVLLEAQASSGEVDVTASQPYAAASFETVRNTGGIELFFSGGFAPENSPGTTSGDEDSAPFANLVANCVFSTSLAANCLVNPNVLAFPRAAAAGGCFSTDAEGACTAFAVIGGAGNGSASTLELFRLSEESGTGNFTSIATDADAGLAQAKFVRTISNPASGVVYTLGGTSSDLFGAPSNMPSLAISLADGDDNTSLQIDEVDTSALDAASDGLRSHHDVTAVSSSRVLITGGLDAENVPTDTSLWFDPTTGSYSGQGPVLNRSRFGHRATQIQSGPLRGAVLVTGGLTLSADSDETPELVPFAEIYVPE